MIKETITTFDDVARIIHEAKIKLCWGTNSKREPWYKPNIASPNQPWHDVARAQAEAVIKLLGLKIDKT